MLRTRIATGLAAASLLATFVVFVELASRTDTAETVQRTPGGVLTIERTTESALDVESLAVGFVPIVLAAAGLLAAATTAGWPSKLVTWIAGVVLLAWAPLFIAAAWLPYLPPALGLVLAGALIETSSAKTRVALPALRPLASLQLLSVRVALPAIGLGLTLVALEARFVYGTGYLGLAVPAYAATTVLIMLGVWFVGIRGWLFLLGLSPVATLGLLTLALFIPTHVGPLGLLIWATAAAFNESGQSAGHQQLRESDSGSG